MKHDRRFHWLATASLTLLCAFALNACSQPAGSPGSLPVASPQRERAVPHTSFGSGFRYPSGVALWPAGCRSRCYVFVADTGNNAVKAINYKGIVSCVPITYRIPACGKTGFNHPYGVAVDSAGNVYVADTFNNAVKEIARGSSTIVTIGSGFLLPTSVAVGTHCTSAGCPIVVASNGEGKVKIVRPPFTGPTHGTISTVTPPKGGWIPWGVALDAAGNLYVSNCPYPYYAGGVVRLSPKGTGWGPATQVGSEFDEPAGLALDANGNVYAANSAPSHGFIVKVAPPFTKPSYGTVAFIGEGLLQPLSVAVDGSGLLYVAASGNDAIWRVAQ